ncbi:hypothetical protein Syun_031359 [Stephania yunnanensis]|uniref:Uncharacterized protein n=1 Tax=Stephania yunnanensis TaxID=152371 RepID=A0AAP0DWX0_9MAGN
MLRRSPRRCWSVLLPVGPRRRVVVGLHLLSSKLVIPTSVVAPHRRRATVGAAAPRRRRLLPELRPHLLAVCLPPRGHPFTLSPSVLTRSDHLLSICSHSFTICSHGLTICLSLSRHHLTHSLTVSPSASPSSRHHLVVSIICLSLQNYPPSPPSRHLELASRCSRRLELASRHHLDLPLPLALAVSHSRVSPSGSASPSSSRHLAFASHHCCTACAASASPTVRPLPPAIRLSLSRARQVMRRRRSWRLQSPLASPLQL